MQLFFSLIRPKLLKILAVTITIIVIIVIAKICFNKLEKLANIEPEIIRVPVYIEKPPAEPTIVEKTHFREAFIEEIESKQELITLEVTLSEEIELNDSWSNIDAFKKNQKIVYKGTGLYSTDISTINDNSVLIDDIRKIVQIKLNAPSPKLVSIDENSTVYEAIDNGIFRSNSEIKMTTSEQQALMVQVKSTMEEKLKDDEFKTKAENSARNSIIKMYNAVLHSLDVQDYTIEVVFE